MPTDLPNELEKLVTDPEYLPNPKALASEFAAITHTRSAYMIADGFALYRGILEQKGSSPAQAFEQADLRFRSLADAADIMQFGELSRAGPNVEYVNQVLGSYSTL